MSAQVKGHLKNKQTNQTDDKWTYLPRLPLSLPHLPGLVLALQVGLLQGEAARPAAEREEEDGQRAGGRAQPAQRLQEGGVLGEPQRQVRHHCEERRGRRREERRRSVGTIEKGFS